MVSIFNSLDRTFDTLAHAFGDQHAPETPCAHPQVAMFLLVLALVPCALVLGWEGSPWLLGLLGLMGAVLCAALFSFWS
jgi:hypothetical protein